MIPHDAVTLSCMSKKPILAPLPVPGFVYGCFWLKNLSSPSPGAKNAHTFDCAAPRTQLVRAQAILTQVERTYEIDRRNLTQKPTGQLELDIAAADVLKAKADLAAAETVTSKCSVAAPFAGVTVDRKAHEFEYATPGQPLLDVLDDRALEVELTAPSRSLGWLKPGASFQVRIDDTGKTYPGRVTRLGGRVDPASQSVKVMGEITGDASELMAGMSGRVITTPP